MAAATYDTRFEAELRKIIEAERAERLENLSTGSAGDYPAYREQVGYLRALRDVEGWCGEAQTKVNQR